MKGQATGNIKMDLQTYSGAAMSTVVADLSSGMYFILQDE